MILSSRQTRIFLLAQLLASGQLVSANTIIQKLGCSEATLTRYLREIRHIFNATIRYSKSNHSYHMIDAGNLTENELIQMRLHLSLDKKEELPHYESINMLKLEKKTLPLSLSHTAIFKLDRMAYLRNMNRSELVELLINERQN